MTLNLDADIQRQENAIVKEIKKRGVVSPSKIGYYNDLLSANLGGEISNIDTDTAVAQNAQKIFVPSSAAMTTGVVKAGAGNLIAGVFTNLNTTDTRFLLIYDKATAPVGGDSPILSYILGPSGGYELPYSFFPQGIPFDNGIAWAFSTNPDMYSSASAANKVLTFFYL